MSSLSKETGTHNPPIRKTNARPIFSCKGKCRILILLIGRITRNMSKTAFRDSMLTKSELRLNAQLGGVERSQDPLIGLHRKVAANHITTGHINETTPYTTNILRKTGYTPKRRL